MQRVDEMESDVVGELRRDLAAQTEFAERLNAENLALLDRVEALEAGERVLLAYVEKQHGTLRDEAVERWSECRGPVFDADREARKAVDQAARLRNGEWLGAAAVAERLGCTVREAVEVVERLGEDVLGRRRVHRDKLEAYAADGTR